MSRNLTLIAFLLTAFLAYYSFRFYEPKTRESCESVTVVGYVNCGRKTWCFDVRVDRSSEQRLVDPSESAFPSGYKGPAALVTRRGRVSGLSDYELRNSCVPVSTPSG
jgi:hypothetical protein